MARALVIGGTLFMGRALVDQLLERGDDVVIMHRGRGTPFGSRVGEIQCDRNDTAAVRALAGTRLRRRLRQRLRLGARHDRRAGERCGDRGEGAPPLRLHLERGRVPPGWRLLRGCRAGAVRLS